MKKLISVFVMLIILGTSVWATDEDLSTRIPKLKFTGITEMAEVTAGEEFKLELNLKNDSNNTAEDIVISPEIADLPLSWDKPTDEYTLKRLGRNAETTLTYTFNVKPDAKVGTYGIKFNFSYQNIRDEVYTKSQTVYFKVSKEMADAILVIDSVKTTPEVVVAGEKVGLSFNVKNIGELPAKALAVTINNLSKDTFMPSNSIDTRYVDLIDGGKSSTVYFDLDVSKNITKGTNELDIEISYKDISGGDNTTTKKIYINNIQSENESVSTEGGTPKIMISSYYTNPTSIVAGDTLDFGFTFTNTNSVKSIGNIKITIESENGAFIISRGSNTFYVEGLDSKESLNKSIELKAKQDLTSNSYPIDIRFDYEDASGNQYNTTETISLPVTEYSKLVINSVYVQETMVGGTTTLSFDYINMGKAKISNLTATVEGDYSPSQTVNYIGNLDTGSSDYYDIDVVPNVSGTTNGVLVLSFEDSSGRIISERKDFQGFAMEEFVDPGVDEPIPVEPVQEETISTWAIVGYGVGALLVSFILTKLIATKIIRKKLEDEI